MYGGTDTTSGGSWIDAIVLSDANTGPVTHMSSASGDWLLETSDDYTINANTLAFDQENASGTVTFNDGSTINFTDIDEIRWS